MDWMDRPFVFEGFGPAPNDSIKFRLMRPARNSQPDWDMGEARVSTFEIRHSNDVVTQYDGRKPREWRVELWFEDLDVLEALDSVQGRISTLRYRWGITTRAGGTKETLPDGRSYLVLPDTQLVRLTDRQVPPNAPPRATATFRRAVGTATPYGYTEYAPGGYS